MEVQWIGSRVDKSSLKCCNFEWAETEESRPNVEEGGSLPPFRMKNTQMNSGKGDLAWWAWEAKMEVIFESWFVKFGSDQQTDVLAGGPDRSSCHLKSFFFLVF